MAIGIVFNGAMTEAQYRQVSERVSPGNQPPSGMLYHAAGPTESGFCVVEVWESQEVAQEFFEKTLAAELKNAQISVQPVFFNVVNTMQA